MSSKYYPIGKGKGKFTPPSLSLAKLNRQINFRITLVQRKNVKKNQKNEWKTDPPQIFANLESPYKEFSNRVSIKIPESSYEVFDFFRLIPSPFTRHLLKCVGRKIKEKVGLGIKKYVVYFGSMLTSRLMERFFNKRSHLLALRC